MKSTIRSKIQKGITKLQKCGDWPSCTLPPINVDISPNSAHGDYASNIAMQLAKHFHKPPLTIAEELCTVLKENGERVETAPPGFVNFFLNDTNLKQTMNDILAQKESYGKSAFGNHERVLLEFISANPTGPLTMPNGRGGFFGDVLANVHAFSGFDVYREYYINDRGGQIERLGESVARRYLQLQGLNVPYPDELYQGEYIIELAKKITLKDYKLNHVKKMEWVKERLTNIALKLMLEEIQRVVKEKMHIHFDQWFSEQALYKSELPQMLIDQLKEKDIAYEHDGAVWIRTTKFGDEKDRVVVKRSGEGAYFQGDIALLYDRVKNRDIKKTILMLGADHHGDEVRLRCIPKLFDLDATQDVVFMQLVTLMRDGQEVRMSKRKGNFVTMEEVIDEVGHDVARFFFLMISANRHMTFDLDLAKKQSEDNPVFYVQYAYARICSVEREALDKPTNDHANIFEHDAERALVKILMRFPDIVEDIAQTYEVHKLPQYAIDCARTFHHFYAHCRVIDNGSVNVLRFDIVRVTKIVLGNVLRLMGISAPEKM